MSSLSLSPLFGRRIHISGSVHKSVDHADSEAVEAAKILVRDLVKELLRLGATFVVPIDKEDFHPDGRPRCFDWLILETIHNNLNTRPKDASLPLVVGVQHYKNESQISEHRLELWENLKDIEGLIKIENAGHWNMNSKRMDMQALHGDILITLGGDEGVLYLANLYHGFGKPVVPLNLPITSSEKGSLKLYDLALVSTSTNKFFETLEGCSSHDLLNRINFTSRTSVEKKVANVIALLGSLRRPIAFGVRLLNPKHDEFTAVENFFDNVIKPVLENELGYELVVLDGEKNEEPFINQEIFNNLHRSNVVIVDITGERPNCFIELGYALARGIPVMVNAKEGTPLPFDTQPVPTNMWNPDVPSKDQKGKFLTYWKANIQRRRIVNDEPLVQ